MHNCEPSAYPVVIFYPENVNCEHGYLCGEVISDSLLKTKNYFIHEVHCDTSLLPADVIGIIGNISLKKRKRKKLDWITLKNHENLPIVVDVISDYLNLKQDDCQIIVYNQSHFLKSELLLVMDCDRNYSENVVDDHFKSLIFSLKQRQSLQKYSNGLKPFTRLILVKLISILKYVDQVILLLLFIFKYSTLALHISAFVKNAQRSLELMHRRKSFTTLVSGNYILGLVGDWLGGLLIIYWSMSLLNIEDVLQILAVYSEVVVVSLKDMVHYLMGSPADLKLNGPLNNVLGKFFLFHIDLWWAFLGYSRPLLELGFQAFVCLGCLGLSFQIAILADLLAIASFHVYIIYVYAARLYRAQLTGLVSLSRVFLGRKRNPVPGRVDSCPYTTEQLLIGTISFTVLLFLLPTTLVYYVVFTAPAPRCPICRRQFSRQEHLRRHQREIRRCIPRAAPPAVASAPGTSAEPAPALAVSSGTQCVAVETASCSTQTKRRYDPWRRNSPPRQIAEVAPRVAVPVAVPEVAEPVAVPEVAGPVAVHEEAPEEIRLVLIAAGGLLTQARFILSSLPLYSTVLWLLDSPATTSSVRLRPKFVTGDEFVLVASPTQDSWWRTVKACSPDLVSPPSPLPWASLLWHLATGRLIYPV